MMFFVIIFNIFGFPKTFVSMLFHFYIDSTKRTLTQFHEAWFVFVYNFNILYRQAARFFLLVITLGE